MNKLIPPLLMLLLFINGTIIITYKPASASTLVEDTWTTKTSMSQPRWDMSVVEVDGKIYVIGGRPSTPGSYNDNVGINEVYDPKTDKWTTLAPMPTPRESFTIFEHQNKIYCIGGWVRVPHFGGIYQILVNATEVYDIASDKWNTISTSFNVGGDTFAVNEQIFVFSHNQLYEYDMNTDSWTAQIVPFQSLSISSGGVILDEKLVFICEQSNAVREQGNRSIALAVYIYDTKTGNWSEGTTGLAGAFGLVAGVTSGNYAPQKIYVFGRDGNMLPIPVLGTDKATSEPFWPVTQVYDPVADIWSTARASSVLFDLCCVVNVDDILYVIGGSVNEQYIPLGYHGDTPESSEVNSSFLTYQVIVAMVLIVGAVVACAIYVVLQKNPKRKRETKNCLQREFNNMH
ncbi:MAG: hypothetical protein LBQ98_10400 [Nitrososphaerota archaeon]|jgi:hypothetical protein|nr:hypothetical protein [Nitrososphaerota archaeon]